MPFSVGAAGQDVAVASDAQALYPVSLAPVVPLSAAKVEAIIHRVFRRYAFSDTGLASSVRSRGVIGNTVGIFRTFTDF